MSNSVKSIKIIGMTEINEDGGEIKIKNLDESQQAVETNKPAIEKLINCCTEGQC